MFMRKCQESVEIKNKFFEHYAYISTAIIEKGLWDEEDGFFYDLLRTPGGEAIPLKVRSMVGLLPVCAVLSLDEHLLHALGAAFEAHLGRRVDEHAVAAGGEIERDVLVRLVADGSAVFVPDRNRLSILDQRPEALGAFHKAEVEKWWPIIKAANIRAE